MGRGTMRWMVKCVRLGEEWKSVNGQFVYKESRRRKSNSRDIEGQHN